MKRQSVLPVIAALLLGASPAHSHLCDNVFRQADKLIVKPETYNLVVKDSTTFKIFLQNNMDRGIAEISLLADSPAFDFTITPQRMQIPKDQRAYFTVAMKPKAATRTGNYSINFRLVGGGRQFKSFSLSGDNAGEADASARTSNTVAPAAPSRAPAPVAPGPRAASDTSVLLRVKGVPAAPKIDGLLSESGWKSAAVASNFTSTRGGKPASQTIALLSYDRTCLYCSVCCMDDNPQKAPDTDRVEIQLASSSSGQPCYSFTFPVSGSPSYRKILPNRSAVPVEARGVRYSVSRGVMSWVAECAIPLAAFGAEAPSSETVWSLRITRVKTGERPEESYWSADSEYNSEKGLGKIVIVP